MADVTIDNGRLNTLRQDPKMVAKFPFLTLSLTRTSGCCNKSQVTPDFNGMRRAIVALQMDKRAELKQALNVDKLTVDVQDGARIERVVF